MARVGTDYISLGGVTVHSPKWLAWSEGWQSLDTVLYSSDELSQWQTFSLVIASVNDDDDDPQKRTVRDCICPPRTTWSGSRVRKVKESKQTICIVLYNAQMISKALRYGPCVTRGSHRFTCHPHTNHTCLYSPAARHHRRITVFGYGLQFRTLVPDYFQSLTGTSLYKEGHICDKIFMKIQPLSPEI